MAERIKPSPLLKAANDPETQPNIFAYDPKATTSKVPKPAACPLLVHGTSIPQPIKLVTENYFHERIQIAMKGLGYVYGTDIQSFTWPIILRHLNLFMISGTKSGKTMTYLPPILTCVMKNEEVYPQFSKRKGPIAIILCSSTTVCEEVFDLIQKLLPISASRRRATLLTYPLLDIENAEIVVTIPAVLLHCVQIKMFKLKRLCHIVLEDANVLLKNSQEHIYSILKLANKMLERRTVDRPVQLIVSSERWSFDLENLLKMIYSTPVVCIGHELEAALYGNVTFEIKFRKSDRKKSYLEDLLKENWRTCKTVVICENQDAIKLYLYLSSRGVACVYINDDSSEKYVGRKEEDWRKSPHGNYNVLICTDFVFETVLNVTEAMRLIHFSFPTTWTRFVKRFSAFSSLLKSPLDSSQNKCSTFIIIDESCEEQLHKILNLSNRLSKLPSNYKLYVQAFKLERENEKVKNRVELCPDLKMFGKCSLYLCKKRHIVNKAVDRSDDFPESGEVEFKIIDILNVSHYMVQITKHIDCDKQIHSFDNYDCCKLLPCDTSELKLTKNVAENGVYCYADSLESDSTKLYLCQVKEIVGKTKAEIKIFATDQLWRISVNQLYEPPSSLRIADVYLCNLLPPFNDTNFSSKSYVMTRFYLNQHDYKNITLTATISLQLGTTLWLNNAEQIVKSGGTNLVKLDLSKNLKQAQLVEKNANQMSLLHQLCSKYKIPLPQYVKPKQKVPEVKPPKWEEAFLSLNCVEEVYLSSAVSPAEAYVRLVKFNKLLEDLEREITAAMPLPKCSKDEVCAGKYYLVSDPKGLNYSRALVLNIENDQALCYYVDYGDEQVKPITDFYKISEKFLTQLPFQAIQCKLHAISPRSENWDETATDVLYNYMFEPNSDIFRVFLSKVFRKETAPARTSSIYSITLKESLDQILINQLLVDLGLANSTLPLEDFEPIPKPAIEPSSDDNSTEIVEENVHSDEDSDGLQVVSSDDNSTETVEENLHSDESSDGFQAVVVNPEEFLESFVPSPVTVNLSVPAVTYPSENVANQEEASSSVAVAAEFLESFVPSPVTVDPSLPAITYPSENVDNQEEVSSSVAVAVKPVNYLTPDLYWSQNSDSIKIKIKLVDVEEYEVKLTEKRCFFFRTVVDYKEYRVTLPLLHIVSLGTHCAKGREVEIFLKKDVPEEWMRLSLCQNSPRYVHYEFSDNEKEAPSDEGDDIMLIRI